MKSNYLVSINDINDIEIYKKVGITTFLFALEDYSIGYEKTYKVDEINNIKEHKYCLINRVLDNNDIDNLKIILPNIDVDGFIIEDIGLINIIKSLGKKIYLFINHFNCNYKSINKWLEYVDSVFVSNELTYKELEEITKNVDKKVIIHIFGYNQVMYSRRYLLKNYYDYYNLEYSNTRIITDKMGSVKFKMVEDKYGTITLSNKIFDGRSLLNLDNVLYFYLNTSFISTDIVLKFLNNEEINDSDDGFLNKPTIFKLGGKND